MDKRPDHQDRSKTILSQCNDEELLKNARKEIFGSLPETIQFIKGVVKDQLESTGDRLNAAKEHCKLAGLYTDKVEHGVKVELVITELEMDI